MKNKKDASKEFLLEIGTEELPAGYIEPALKQLRETLESSRKVGTLNFSSLDVFGTPNRLVVYLRGLSTPPPQREKIIGPSKEMAFDKDGKPTQACLGFLRSKEAELKDLHTESTPRGEYVFIEKTKESPPIKKFLAATIPNLIATIKFPKVMRWDGSGVRFARPVRWILALLDSEAVGIKFGKLTASDTTRLPRYISPAMKPVKIKSAKDYFRTLEKFNIILNQEERHDKITTVLKKSASASGAADNFNADLVRTVNYLVESPVGFVGKFRKEYLDLPVEVLESSMAKNQKIFLLKDKGGKTLPYFAAIINGKRKDTAMIRKTFEAILNAKLKDSIFFLEEDLKTALGDRVEALKGVVFQAKLGTVYDRVMRLQKLSLDIANSFPAADKDAAKKKLERAALLSKADLMTQMVKEFPDLQGIIGREYAKRTGEDKEIYSAIYEHYLPKGPADPLPSTYTSSILAIADKIDTIVGFYAIGLIPTGSEDPYGIRRASLGILKILLENKYPILFDDLMEWAFSRYGSAIACDKNAVKRQIVAFQKDRLKNILLDKNFKDDIIDAVLCPGLGKFDRLSKKLIDLSSISKAKYFLEAAKVIERISNILKSEKKPKEDAVKVNPALFKEQLEKDLWGIYEKNKDDIEEKAAEGDYIEATRIYAKAFHDPIHLFFEKVVVNTEDQALRANRYALLRAIHAIYVDKVADLSNIKLQG